MATLDQREKCGRCKYCNSDDHCTKIRGQYGSPTPCDYIVLCGSFKEKQNDEMSKIVQCPSCKGEELFGNMHWLDGRTMCRKCINDVWRKRQKGGSI